MKTFSQMLQEFPHNDKLDKLRHDTTLSPKRQKQLSVPLVHFEDFDYEIWQSQYPPSNTSFETFNELKHLQSLQHQRNGATEDIIIQDKDIIGSFTKYLDEHELEVDMERIKEVYKESGAIILTLKRFYDRPRPKKLAKSLGIELTEFQLKTSETSSYPSGHAVQGRLLGKLIADELPLEHRANILDIAKRIGYYRQVAGAHYGSDTKFGHRLADELYRTVKIPVELGEMSLVAMQQQIADLDGGLDVVSKSRRIGNTGNLTSKQFANKLEKGMGATNIKITEPLAGDNTSHAFDMFTFEFDGDVYSIHLAGKVVRGTKSTSDNETSFLLVLAARQHGAKDEAEDIKMKMIDKNVWSKIGGLDEKSAMSLVAYMEEQPTWFLSHRKQVNVLIQKIGKKPPKRYVKDSTKYPINQQAKALYKENFGETLELDKWNPADIWLEYSSLPKHKTLTDLNNFCYSSIKSVSGIVGVSLKKGSGKLSYINYDKEKEPYDLKKINLKMSKLWATLATIEFEGPGLEGISLGFRIFGGKATDIITGEADKKGTEAVQGKVKLTLLDQFTGGGFRKQITAVGGADILDYNRNTGKYSLTKVGLKKYKKVKTAWTYIKGKNLSFARGAQKNNYNNAFKNEKNFINMLNKENLPENKGKSVVNSRFQTLMLCQIISSMKQKAARKLALQLLKYGKSMSEWSAAHLKLE